MFNFYKKFSSSVHSRYIYPWLEKHFHKSKYGKNISKFKNIAKNEICFFIGNGPSLKAEDLTTLKNNGIDTFAFNRIYHIFSDTDWRPTYYLCQDEKIFLRSSEIINSIRLPVKFIPIQFSWDYGVNIDNAYYFNICYLGTLENGYRFSNNVSQKIYAAMTCMYSAFQIAVYMGYTKIYLIGVDHHFHTSINSQGKLVIDESAKDYFSSDYNKDKENLYIPNTDESTLTYISMKEHAQRLGIDVFNATRGGKLEVFPRVSFDEQFLLK